MAVSPTTGIHSVLFPRAKPSRWPPAVKTLGWKYFFVYVATNASNAVVSYFLFPETKHKTLEEIGLLFGDTNVRVYEGAPRTVTYGGGVGGDEVGVSEKEKAVDGVAHVESGSGGTHVPY